MDSFTHARGAVLEIKGPSLFRVDCICSDDAASLGPSNWHAVDAPWRMKDDSEHATAPDDRAKLHGKQFATQTAEPDTNGHSRLVAGHQLVTVW